MCALVETRVANDRVGALCFGQSMFGWLLIDIVSHQRISSL